MLDSAAAGIGLLSLSRRYNPSIVFPSICEDTVSVDLEESIVGISWFTVRFNTCFAANFPSDLLSPLEFVLVFLSPPDVEHAVNAMLIAKTGATTAVSFFICFFFILYPP
ncbi:Uncharacterised protein [Streptococcus pneumoniae]|nr:Uncharacterised protein [Streptococcus pneumoniae]